MARYELNVKKNGIEIYFDSAPNSVLLTRGREGFVVYIPQGRDDIADVFEKAGIKELKV